MLRLLKGLLAWALFGFGVVVIAALTQRWWWPEEQATRQTLVFNQQNCEYSLDLDPHEWEATPYIVNTYASLKASAKPEAYLHFPADRIKRALYDTAACTRDGESYGQTDGGLRIHYETLQCAPDKPGLYSGPPGRYRLYGSIEGRHITVGAGIFTDSQEALQKYQPRLKAVIATLKPINCGIDLAAQRLSPGK